MRRLLSVLVTLAWGLWLGGLIALFLAITSLFRTFHDNRPLAGSAAAGIFHAFERYQLGLAAVALLTTFGWRLLPGAAWFKTTIFALLGLTTATAGAVTLLVTPRIDALRLQGMTTGPAFGRLHGIAMLLYTSETALLVLAGMLLPATIRRDAARIDGTAPNTEDEPVSKIMA